MLSVFRTVLRVSNFSDLPVLIAGKTGTGKEVIARAIHDFDLKRSSGYFLAMNCGALNRGVAESELFGHKRGAFTGADRDRLGLFRAANGGVLFLDEIGELSLDLQTKLLRVLQEKRLLPVGDEREININVRVVAATSRDLNEMVRRGEFRDDLYHRLNVISVHVPPLRERPEDIPPLVHHFLRKHNQLVTSLAPVRPSAEFLKALQRARLPGNARQLENIVRRSLLSWEGAGPLELRDLPAEIWEDLAGGNDSAQAALALVRGGTSDLRAYALEWLARNDWNLSRSLDSMERLLITFALEATQGNKTKTAQRLGITPRSIYNKLHRQRRAG